MIKNIIFYIICLILSCALFIKYNEYLFLLIFIFLIITPIIFICINFYVKRHLEFDIALTSKSNNEDNLCNFNVKVSNKGLLPIRKLAIVLKYKNSKSSSKLSKKIIFTSVTSKSDEFLMCNIMSKHCGIIDITLEKVKIYDPFSITFLSKKIKKKIACVVLPELYKEEQNIKRDSFYEEDECDDKVQYKNNYINNKSELVDYSEYKQGDSINKINWKLSAKKDKLFVKNYEGRESKIGLIIVENIIKENDSYEKILQKVFSISMNYIDNGINHKIVWYDNNTSKYVCDYIDSSEKTYLAIRHILQCDIVCEAYKGIEYLNDKLTSNCSDIYYVTNKTTQSDIIKKYRNVNIIKIDEGKEYEDNSIIFSKDINLEARNYKNISVFSSAILLGVTIIILGMLFGIVRPSFIENDRVNEARQQLNKSIFQDKSIEKIFNYFIYGKVSGGINEGRFGNIGEIEYDNSIHLKVALDKRYFNQDIYLKGYVADVYTGNSFKQSPKNDFELNDVLDKSDIFSSEYKFNENMFVFQKNIDANDISLDDICANRGITELTQNEISAFNNMKPEDKSMYIFFEMIRSSIRVQNVAPNDKYLYVPYNSNCNNNINYYKDLCICANKKLQ